MSREEVLKWDLETLKEQYANYEFDPEVTDNILELFNIYITN